MAWTLGLGFHTAVAISYRGRSSRYEEDLKPVRVQVARGLIPANKNIEGKVKELEKTSAR